MSTITGYERLDSPSAGSEYAIRVARALCLAAVGCALIAGVLIAVLVLSSPTAVPVRVGTLLGVITFGWSSVSLLVSAVLAATSAV